MVGQECDESVQPSIYLLTPMPITDNTTTILVTNCIILISWRGIIFLYLTIQYNLIIKLNIFIVMKVEIARHPNIP